MLDKSYQFNGGGVAYKRVHRLTDLNMWRLKRTAMMTAVTVCSVGK